MEALGGVGYLENTENESINISRIYRDCCVLSIWEGTTDVLASDTLRVLSGRTGNDVLNAMDRWVSKAPVKGSGHPEFARGRVDIISTWSTLRDKIRRESHEQLLPYARSILFQVADVIMGVLLIVDAENDLKTPTTELCFRYLKGHSLSGGVASGNDSEPKRGLKLNQEIVFGDNMENYLTSQSKL
jgi:Acyl-CoA dehydrogenase, C-terminal domain